MDESGDEEEENAIINQALDEIGIDLNAQVGLFVFMAETT